MKIPVPLHPRLSRTYTLVDLNLQGPISNVFPAIFKTHNPKTCYPSFQLRKFQFNLIQERGNHIVKANNNLHRLSKVNAVPNLQRGRLLCTATTLIYVTNPYRWYTSRKFTCIQLNTRLYQWLAGIHTYYLNPSQTPYSFKVNKIS